MPEIYDLKCSVCDTQLNFWETKDGDGHKLIYVQLCAECSLKNRLADPSSAQEIVYIDGSPWTRGQAQKRLDLLTAYLEKVNAETKLSIEKFNSLRAKADKFIEALGY